MDWLEGLAMAVALGTDAFSVAMVVGVQQFDLAQIVRISNTIGIFHIFMPLLGLYGGKFIERLIAHFFNYNSGLDKIFNIVGAGLLMLIGIYMIMETLIEKEEDMSSFHLNNWGLVVLATSVSIDSLSVGVSLGMLDFHVSIVLVFGLVAAIMMGSGLYLGSKIGHWLGDNVQVIGGAVLIFMGLHFIGFI